MPKFTTTPAANRLLLEGSLALSEIQCNGCRVDKGYLDSAIEECSVKIKEADALLKADPVYKTWRKRFGDKTNTASSEQLAKIVFTELGYKAKKFTEKTDREAGDEQAFDGINEPFLKHYFAAQKLRKGRDTYLYGIKRELVQHADKNYYVHPRFWLNTVSSFRSSGSDPNFQNIPARNPIIAEMIRRCYIPRPGQHIIECDYAQIEVRVPCPYTNDPMLMEYVNNPAKDMHRDMAMQIFFLTETQAKQKNIRHIAKNGYVFPTFYGSYFAQCAPNIWSMLELGNIQIGDTGVTVIDHMADRGITELGDCETENPKPGTFVAHLKKIEEHFWGTRFQVYAQWKKDWYAAYLKNGGMQSLVGYAWNIPLDRKQVCNYPIQCDAFQCTLWSLPRINQFLRKYKMKTRAIGEIHDSVQFDGPPKERDDVIENVTKIMTKDIRKDFTWLNVDLVLEPELCPVDRSWNDKVALVEREGTYVPGDMAKWEKKYGDWNLQE